MKNIIFLLPAYYDTIFIDDITSTFKINILHEKLLLSFAHNSHDADAD